MKLHILAIAVHPDDLELGAGATLAKHARMGQAVGIVDLTKGELGTRGTPELRLQEAASAAKIMGIAVRENLGMRDGFRKLIADACFLAGLRKIETTLDGVTQTAWRPKRVYHMIQDRFIEPTFIVDVSDTHDVKMEAIKAYNSQFHNPNSDEPLTYIAQGGFLDAVEARSLLLGKRIGVKYGEGFICENLPGIDSLDNLLLPQLA